jgi:hypothetical protein
VYCREILHGILIGYKIEALQPMISFSPPYTPLASATQALQQDGFALLRADDLINLCQCPRQSWDELALFWQHLEPDQYLKDGGKYRQRKHASVLINHHDVSIIPYRPHFQPTSYNALHGGMDRWFTPCDAAFIDHPALQSLLLQLGDIFTATPINNPTRNASQKPTWFVEIHQFRIDTIGGIGRPTPEGAHRDGVNFVAVLLIDRQAIKGGETRVFATDSPHGQRFTLDTPLSILLLDDQKVLHETTPIQPMDRNQPGQSWRDTLVLTYRLDSFLDSKNPSA